jgi:hypothetical protein
MHGVASSTMFQYKDDTIRALNNVLGDTISFPWGDEDACVKLADGFYAANGRSLNGCVLAIDGLLVKIACPDAYDETDSQKYYTRKHFYAFNVQAGCDADLRFRIASVKCAGSTHDSTAWAVTGAARIMRSDPNALPDWAYFVGDDAYKSQHDKILTPWPGRRLRETAPHQDDFNYHQSRCVFSRPYPALAKHDVLERFSDRSFLAGRAARSSAPSVSSSLGSVFCGARFEGGWIHGWTPFARVCASITSASTRRKGPCRSSPLLEGITQKALIPWFT